jgi:hypothetical protein
MEQAVEKDYMFLDKNGQKVNKNDLVKITNHPNALVNGNNYMCLRLWMLSEDIVECLQETNGIIKHVAVDRKYLEKIK